MPAWDAYPPTYRQAEVESICAALQAGECVSLVGLSGAGKSNLCGFLCARARAAGLPTFLLVDCNRMLGTTPADLYALLAEVLAGEDPAPIPPGLRGLERLVASRLADQPGGLCLVLDRFDALGQAGSVTASSLRALRDRFKYQLTYLTATRRPLASQASELAELFFAHTLWLGPLSPADARWSAASYAARRGLSWGEDILARLLELSWGYPALLRGCCEAVANGAELEVAPLRAHPAVQRRAAEFWLDGPSPQELRLSGLEGQPLLALAAPLQVDPAALTAAEQRLLDYLQAHPGQVCAKDELVAAIWPDEIAQGGIRDDSLAQLVHRLRDKIGARFIQTVPARGYRFTG